MGLEVEEKRERIVDSLKLYCVEATGRAPETLRVDDGRLLDQYASAGPIKLDRGPKGGRPSARRGWRDEHGAQPHEVIGLNDHGEPRAFLLPAASATRRR